MFLTSQKFTPQKGACFKIVPPLQNHRPPPPPDVINDRSLIQREKKSPLGRPNYTSIQVFYFKISVKKKRRKEIRFEKQKLFS